MKKQSGFTLMELMIVVVIVGILAGFAYPSYLEQMRKTRRAECAGNLASLANGMERFFTINNTYAGTAAAGPPGSPTGAVFPSTTCPIEGGAATYNLVVNAAGASTFDVRAVPTGVQADDKCGTLTMTNRGLRGVTGQSAGVTAAQCW